MKGRGRTRWWGFVPGFVYEPCRRDSALPALLLTLFILAVALRLTSVYPPTLRHDPAQIALQACRIIDGERPLFWPGQSWMGAAGTYGEALLFLLFGKNTLVMSCYAWLLSGVWIGLSLLLVRSFFGARPAVVAALIWLIPTPIMMYWSAQARNDFQVLFIATPVILLVSHRIIGRVRAGQGWAWWAGFLGLFSGFSFWQNMASGPCLVVSFAVLMVHLGRVFWRRFVWIYAPAWLLGFAPVIGYNYFNGFPILGQSGGFNDLQTVRSFGKAFLTNALPIFWGLEPVDRVRSPRAAAALLFMLWVAVVYGLYLRRVYLRWRRREDLVPHQLVLGLLLFHLAVLLATGYGASFTTRGNPVLYFTSLYGVAIAVPAVVIAGNRGLRRGLLLLPLLFYLGNNAGNARGAARAFISGLFGPGGSAVMSFPDPGNATVQFLKAAGLTQGYCEQPYVGTHLNLAGLHAVEVARPFSERVLPYSLRSDASAEIFWVEDRGLPVEAFEVIGARFETAVLPPLVVYHGFRKDERPESLIEEFAVEGSPPWSGAEALRDRRIETSWSIPAPLPESWVRFDFIRKERVAKIVLLPRDTGSLPNHVLVQVSDDGVSWRTVREWRAVGPFFWSVRHPFLKMVKPRCEMVLGGTERTRFLRLFLPAQPGRCSIREAFLYREEAGEPAAATLDQERAALEQALTPLQATHQVVGDHYFMSYFKLRGFDVEFLPNRLVNSSGSRNPFLTADLPLDFSRPLCLIVPRSHRGAVHRTLARHGIPAREVPFPRHVVFLTSAVATDAGLYWCGFDLLAAPPRRAAGG